MRSKTGFRLADAACKRAAIFRECQGGTRGSLAPCIKSTAQFALAGTGLTALVVGDLPLSDGRSELFKLAEDYNTIRETQSSGSARTTAMTAVVRRMAEVSVGLDQPPDITDLLTEKNNRGRRLVAYAYLLARPDPQYLEALVDSIINIEDKPFGQCWGIQAIGRVIASRSSGATLDLRILTKLRSFLSHLTPGTDRYYELQRILQGFRER